MEVGEVIIWQIDQNYSYIKACSQAEAATSAIDSFHIVISLSNRSSIEKSIKLFLKMKGQIANVTLRNT